MKRRIKLHFKKYEKLLILILIILLTLLIFDFINNYFNTIEGITVRKNSDKKNEQIQDKVETQNKQREQEHTNNSSKKEEKAKNMINKL